MLRRYLLMLVALSTTSCTNPLGFGPGRVAITLDAAFVHPVHETAIWPEAGNRPAGPEFRELVELRISSEVDLLKYFEDRDRLVTTRCSVDGNRNGHSYSAWPTSLVPIVEPGNASGAARRHRYRVYAFIDLEASDEQYERGKPASTLNLRTETFDALRCHVIGVQKAPVLFPRSNDVVVSFDTFHELMRQGGVR